MIADSETRFVAGLPGGFANIGLADEAARFVRLNFGTLSNLEARKWYLAHEARIPDLIDKSLSLEKQAKQAFELRNQFRTLARDLMADGDLAEKSIREEPNLTWQQVVQKAKNKGYSDDDVYKYIIESSLRSRQNINRKLGLE